MRRLFWGLGLLVLLVVVIGGAEILAFFGSIWLAIAAIAGAGFAGGFFAGGDLGLGMMVLLGLCVLLPTAAISFLTEWGDPRIQMWERERKSKEYATTVVAILTALFLNWAGVPIWATVTGQPIFSGVLTVAYLIIGFVWGIYLWRSLSKFLNDRRHERISAEVTDILKGLMQLRDLRASMRRELGLTDSKPLFDEKGFLIETADQKKRTDIDWDTVGRDRTTHTDRQDWINHDCLGLKKNKSKPITDEELNAWIAGFAVTGGKKINVHPAFQKYFEVRVATIPAANSDEFTSQIYLWTMFWPFSMAFRLIRKILTLRILREIWDFIYGRIRFVYAKVAKQSETELVFGTAQPPAKDGGTPPSSPNTGEDDQPAGQTVVA